MKLKIVVSMPISMPFPVLLSAGGGTSHPNQEAAIIISAGAAAGRRIPCKAPPNKAGLQPALLPAFRTCFLALGNGEVSARRFFHPPTNCPSLLSSFVVWALVIRFPVLHPESAVSVCCRPAYSLVHLMS